MSKETNELQLEGIVRGRAAGKEHLPGPMTLECRDGKRWVVDYNQQSPFRAFTDRHVLVSGEPYTPTGSHMISLDRSRPLGHLKVSSMRLVDAAPDAEVVEVGAGRKVTGRFQHGAGGQRESSLFFSVETSETFRVANDPAGAIIGEPVEVWAHPVQLRPSMAAPSVQYLWIICPCSMADLWEWNERHL